MSPAPNAVDSILAVDDVVVRFDTPEGPITAVDDVSFKVRSGEFLSVIGPSGCGKSTLFNVIGGLLAQHQGVVSVGGETISGPHKSIGMVFQEESTFPWRTLIDNVSFPLELVGIPRSNVRSVRVISSRWSASTALRIAIQANYPAVCDSGSPLPGHWPQSRKSC